MTPGAGAGVIRRVKKGGKHQLPIDALKSNGAVGDILYHFVNREGKPVKDKNGRPISKPISELVCSVELKDLKEIRKALESCQLRICVVGIGRIGLPTALSFANAGLPTIGVDINSDLNSKRINQISFNHKFKIIIINL